VCPAWGKDAGRVACVCLPVLAKRGCPACLSSLVEGAPSWGEWGARELGREVPREVPQGEWGKDTDIRRPSALWGLSRGGTMKKLVLAGITAVGMLAFAVPGALAAPNR